MKQDFFLKKFKDKKILVTGGFGFIGKSFIKKICNYCKSIFILDNLKNSFIDEEIIKFKNIKFFNFDIRNKKKFKNIPDVDYVYHLAAPSSIILFNKNKEESVDITIKGFLNIINFSIKRKIKKLIFPSSGSVYGANDFPYSENILSPTPINIYGKTKLACEYLMRIYDNDLDYVSMRIFAGFGPEENHKGEIASVVTLFLNKILKNESPVIWGDGSQTRDFIWIDDIVDAMINVTFNDFKGILNVGSGVSISFNEVIDLINKALNKNIKPIYVKKPVNYLESTKSNITLLKKILGRKPNDPRKKIIEYAKMFVK